MALILPNTIANLTPADGDKLDQNFDTIVAWANQDAITRDGSTAMTSPLLLPGVPTATNQAATKGYVDSAVPVGVMWAFAGDVAPVGWELCRGQALSRATYAALFAVLGTKFGTGDGSTTFNIPNMQGRSPMGHWPGGGWAGTNGAYVGSADATLAAHSHVAPDHYHAGGATGVENAGHSHTMNWGEVWQSTADPVDNVNVFGVTVGQGIQIHMRKFNSPSHPSSGQNVNHIHGIASVGSADRTLTTTAAGTTATNANIHPAVVCNFIMRVQ